MRAVVTIGTAAALGLVLLSAGPALAKRGGSGGGGEDPPVAADPAISFLTITIESEHGTNVTGDLWVVDADGSNERCIVTGECGRAAWSRDMDPDTDGYQGLLAFGHDADGVGLYTVRPDGTGLTKLVSTDGIPQRVSWAQAAWTDGNTKIAFQARTDTDGDGVLDKNELYVCNEDGSDPIRVTNTPLASERSPSWSPDGLRLAYTVRVDGDADAFVATFAPGDANGPLKDPINVTATGPLATCDVQFLEWARTSNTLVVQDNGGGGVGNLWKVDVAKPGSPVILTGDFYQLLVHNASPSWSPDDSQVLFSADKGQIYWGVLWTINADGTGKTELISSATKGKRGTVIDMRRSAPSWRP